MLEQDIGDIRENLRRGRYPNEAAVSQGIVRRLLATLGWPIYDPQVVYPEYTIERLHVDYALCHPASKPRIFVEVKGVGKGDKAERQLFEYAFHMGVPLAVLTDGREWSFFLPAGAGSYDERRIYKLDLVEHDVAKSVRRFERYLRYEAVCSEEAFAAAQEDYRDIAREREVTEALPKAWVKLVAEEHKTLLEVVAECVKELCGHRPAPDTVVRFLQTIQPNPGPLPTLGLTPVSVVPPTAAKDDELPKEPPVTPAQPLMSPPQKVPNSSFGFTLFDKFYSCQSQRDLLVGAIEALVVHKPSFIEKFVALPQHGHKSRWIARDPNELHPGNPHRAQHGSYSHRLKSGYWLKLQFDLKQKKRFIERACEVAGINYGTDLKINDPPIRPRPRGRGPRRTGA